MNKEFKATVTIEVNDPLFTMTKNTVKTEILKHSIINEVNIVDSIPTLGLLIIKAEIYLTSKKDNIENRIKSTIKNTRLIGVNDVDILFLKEIKPVEV